MIQTVLGPVNNQELGYCQCHEHLFIKKGRSFEINPALCMEDINKSTEELLLYKKSSGHSLVDAQPVGCGRMADYLARASFDSGVNIIASTGFHKLLFYGPEHWIFQSTEDELARLFIDEIQNGMYVDGNSEVPLLKVGSKAGIIKTAAAGNGVAGEYKKLFSAAAAASIETGAPIMCHLDTQKDALSVVRFLTDFGIQPSNIILCHLDRAHYDAGFHMQIAETGVYLEYDTIGRFKYHSDEKEVELIKQLVQAGYGEQILLGLDTTNQRLKSYGGEIGLDYILNVFIDKMLKEGISEAAVRKFTVENPAEALSIKSKII